jgi:tRNA threonylcarbamoyladenosine biosynthesis protein TsaB
MSEADRPLILAIETATRAGGVALARAGEILASASGDPAASHSTDLIQTVETILQSAGTTLNDVELFAAALGPGSFTGLRIGLATIKSFAVCIGRPCAGFSTLAAIAHSAGASERTVALLPAGRGELFAQMFSVTDGQVRELDAAAHLSPKAILEKYGASGGIVWAGEGAHQLEKELAELAAARGIELGASATGPGDWKLAPIADRLANSIAALALNEYRGGRTVTPDELHAVYVRASDAEINEKWQREK